jgi:hypothetical protein
MSGFPVIPGFGVPEPSLEFLNSLKHTGGAHDDYSETPLNINEARNALLSDTANGFNETDTINMDDAL